MGTSSFKDMALNKADEHQDELSHSHRPVSHALTLHGPVAMAASIEISHAEDRGLEAMVESNQ